MYLYQTMRRLIIFLIIIDHLTVNGQISQKKDSVNSFHTRISFLFIKSIPKDSTDLDLKIIFKNGSNRVDSIYSYLEDGDSGDENYNLNIRMEKLEGKKYRSLALFYYQNIDPNDKRPFNGCIDLPKKAIPPFSSDTIVYNLLKSGNLFEKGKYRFKAYVRTNCKLDRGRGTVEYPFLPEIEYAESKWIYFEVKNVIFKRISPL